MVDNGSNTIFLAIIAVATSIQTVMLIAAAVYALRGYRKVTAQIDALHRLTSPFVARASRVLDAVEDTTTRVRTLDDNVRHAVAETVEATRRNVADFKANWWPVLATGKAAVAAIHAFRQPTRKSGSKQDRFRRKRTASEDEEARFANEGGTHARS